MDLNTFQPTFLIQIEGQALAADITREITSFVFEDNEEELDVLELSVTNRNLQFVDDPLFQEGNEIVARLGYVDIRVLLFMDASPQQAVHATPSRGVNSFMNEGFRGPNYQGDFP